METPILIHAQQLQGAAFGDARLEKGAALYEAMCERQCVNIRRISQSRAEQVGYYRFLENEAVSIGELVKSLAQHCEQRVSGQHVLAISHSSEINLQAHAGRLKPEEVGWVES